MITVESYKRPETVAEALKILKTGKFGIIAGGTDVIPQMRHNSSRQLLDISKLGLDFIKENGNTIEIGAAATHTQLNINPLIQQYLPLLATACGLVGSWQIRNRGTVGGNIVNASPCADSAPAMLIYNAKVVLLSSQGQRSVNLSEFIKKPYITEITPKELLHSFICQKADPSEGNSFFKLGRRQAVNISRMTVAVSLAKDDAGKILSARIAVGSVFPTPSRVAELENKLQGQLVSIALFEDVANLAADLMIKASGVRWSTPYKKPVLIGLTRRALINAAGLKANQA
jgi:CO/xanthine dehydrogenase FAD-binding subunit